MISKSFLFQNWIPKRNKKSLIYKKVLISIDTRCWKKIWFLPNFWDRIFSRIRIWVDIKETESNQALITHKQHLKNSRFNKSKRNKKQFLFSVSQPASNSSKSNWKSKKKTIFTSLTEWSRANQIGELSEEELCSVTTLPRSMDQQDYTINLVLVLFERKQLHIWCVFRDLRISLISRAIGDINCFLPNKDVVEWHANFSKNLFFFGLALCVSEKIVGCR